MKKDLLLLVLFIPYFISSQVNITTINEIPEQCEWNCDGTIYFEALVPELFIIVWIILATI